MKRRNFLKALAGVAVASAIDLKLVTDSVAAKAESARFKVKQALHGQAYSVSANRTASEVRALEESMNWHAQQNYKGYFELSQRQFEKLIEKVMGDHEILPGIHDSLIAKPKSTS